MVTRVGRRLLADIKEKHQLTFLGLTFQLAVGKVQ